MNSYRPGGFSILPLVVKNLLIINGLFFLATVAFDNAFDINLYRILGLHMPFSEHFRPYQLVTYMFMHGNLSHLFFNMFALWMFGNTLENVWGPKKFLTFYFLTAFGAALLHMGVNYLEMMNLKGELLKAGYSLSELEEIVRSGSYRVIPGVREKTLYAFYMHHITPTVGASGAVFGILLAFGMMFPNTIIYVFFAIPLKAKYFVMIYGALELYFGFTSNGNIAHFAHIGGMLFGLLVLLYWKKRNGSYF
ncbi:MAG: rhomboid family intramembrane serine protease [Bacteroidetes bacterium]|nr:rhomboid family intramembrane serine protease [Bacteroidota bacterium]